MGNKNVLPSRKLNPTSGFTLNRVRSSEGQTTETELRRVRRRRKSKNKMRKANRKANR